MGGNGPFRCCRRLILASASPRRQKLLADLGLEFEVAPAAIDEHPEPGEEPAGFAVRMAVAKAGLVAVDEPDAWVLGADTIVVYGTEILGKPASRTEAIECLLRLAGRRHHVLTGFCLRCEREALAVARLVSTEVFFADFSRETAAAYVATGEPMDKAGAYGIQGIGGFLVERITGSYSNVVGLPIAEVLEELQRFGVVEVGGLSNI